MPGRSSDEREYVAIANEYARQVIAGERPACKWVHLACERQVRDLERAARGEFEWRFDADKAARICIFAELLPHVEGRWKSKTIILEPWQCFILTTIFGWVDAEGFRRFRKALTVLPRKNAKTTTAAIVALYLLGFDNEPGAQVYSAAKTRAQAQLSWSIAKKMVDRTPQLRGRGLEPMAHSITFDREGGYFKPLSRDADSLEGLNVHGAIIDELHVHPDREVWDVIDNGITARRQPLVFAISTEGDRAEGIFVDQVKYLQEILNGNHEDESYFGIYYGLDQEDDWTLESSWMKASPNWDVSVSPREMRDKFNEAQQLPSAQATFLTKRCNVRVGAGNAYFNMLAWRNLCKDEALCIDQFAGVPCYITVDLASRKDITAVMTVFRKNGHYYAFGRYYLPETALERGQPNAEIYRGWSNREELVMTTGPRTDYQRVQADAIDLAERFHAGYVGIDPNYNGEHFRQELQRAGVQTVEIYNNQRMFTEPMKELGAMIPAGRVHHNGDPVLDWAMGNVTAKTDMKGDVYPTKAHPDNKIDPAVALIAGMSIWLRQEETQEWDGRVIAV